MPCDAIRLVNLDAGKMPPEILLRGLIADGHAATLNGRLVSWTQNGIAMSYDATTGKLEVQKRSWDKVSDEIVSGVKQSFSRQLVRDQAKRFGWTLKQEGNKFVVSKRV